MTAMTQDKINKLNEQMTGAKTAHEVARDNGLELLRWYDQSGGLYRDSDGELVFGWEGIAPGFDNQVEDIYSTEGSNA